MKSHDSVDSPYKFDGDEVLIQQVLALEDDTERTLANLLADTEMGADHVARGGVGGHCCGQKCGRGAEGAARLIHRLDGTLSITFVISYIEQTAGYRRGEGVSEREDEERSLCQWVRADYVSVALSLLSFFSLFNSIHCYSLRFLLLFSHYFLTIYMRAVSA